MVGDTVATGAVLRATVEGAPGAELRLITDGGQLAVPPVVVAGATFEHRFRLSTGTWVRAEVARPDLAEQRGAACGEATAYCRNLLLVEAMTSALYLEPGVTVEVGDGTVTLANGIVERTWSLSPFRTERLVDRRSGRIWTAGSADFRLVLDGVEVASDALSSGAPRVEQLPGGGLRLTFDLGVAHRVVETWPDVAGFRSHTVVQVPALLSGYTLDEAAVGPALATAHAFRSGADWRSDEGWAPDLAIGDANTGDWRRTVSQPTGTALHEPGQWLSVRDADDARLFMVTERADLPSSRVAYDGEVAAAEVDLSRDIVLLGPIEESAHVQNPGPGPARHRAVQPPLALEPVFTGVAVDGDDEPWQHWVALSRHRMPPWPKAVTFNTNNVDANRISTGAKDDVDHQEFLDQLDVARRLGVETFVFDDGWQARSGDWCADSSTCPEPRGELFGPRVLDERFAAVRAALGDMALGLWMSPMHFHTSSRAFTTNPQWACTPVGDGTAGLTALQPEDGSS
ncbi:MAG: alpha-galactosidase, partial [Acidimicrobiales bacterium]